MRSTPDEGLSVIRLMKVFMSADTVGGVWDYCATLAWELHSRGHELLLAALGEPSADQLSLLPPSTRVEARRFRLEWMPDASLDVASGGAWLSEQARRWGPDVAHLNQLAYATHDFGAPTLVVVHSDVLSWFAEVKGVELPAEWRGYTGAVTRGIAAADLLVAPTEYQSALTLRHYGRAADRVIHNGVVPPREGPQARGRPLLLSAGRAWDEAKGMATYDAAVGALGPDAPPAHLLGEELGPQGQRFTPRHLVAHGRAGRLAVNRWMDSATHYVGASIYEPFGLAPVEAALRGCALVLADVGSFRELWDGCAEFFPPRRAELLADRIRDLLQSPEHSRALAAAARERALERYTAAPFGERYVGLYREMSERRKGKSEKSG